MPADENRDHPLDGLADDLYEWMNGEVGYYVEAMRGGYRSPFSAPVNAQEKKDYWARQMFQAEPNGTIQYDKPNQQGRDQVLRQYGVQTYADILNTVKPKQGFRPPVEPTEDLVEATIPPMPEEGEPV